MEQDSHETLSRSVSSFHRWIQAIAGTAIAAYVVWFAFYLDTPISKSGDAWGQFGDFVGGLLNPLIAYAAFHWITRSVLIQSKELADTRAALRDAAVAQSAQAAHASKSLALTHVRARIDAISSNIELSTRELQFVADQFAKHSGSYASHTMDGGAVSGAAIRSHLAAKSADISSLVKQRDALLDEMRALLTESSAA